MFSLDHLGVPGQYTAQSQLGRCGPQEEATGLNSTCQEDLSGVIIQITNYDNAKQGGTNEPGIA